MMALSVKEEYKPVFRTEKYVIINPLPSIIVNRKKSEKKMKFKTFKMFDLSVHSLCKNTLQSTHHTKTHTFPTIIQQFTTTLYCHVFQLTPCVMKDVKENPYFSLEKIFEQFEKVKGKQVTNTIKETPIDP